MSDKIKKRLRYWVARDEDGGLYMIRGTIEPIRVNGRGYSLSGFWLLNEQEECKDILNEEYNYLKLDSRIFPEIKWSDGPKEVHISLGPFEDKIRVLESITKKDLKNEELQETLLNLFERLWKETKKKKS